MNKTVLLFLIFLTIFITDQAIKYAFVYNNWGYEGSCLSFQLAYNYGVAFSMFSFLKEYLKYIQLALVFIGVIYLYFNKAVLKEYALPIALLFAGGLSNILDRFTYEAVVDYIYWHCGFEFAIFNLADMIINLAVGIIIYKQIWGKNKEEV
ncbi:signal peptidase II [Malaciobacter marinus]|jgi:signal peptidase II|uniref:Lipoprotein signal peptidase n=1 Tax=Malaciobacter marinus TaxID=505249 RepID=A0AB36ZTF9_9BACT|nr:signal peptidase II [Malaciobacter marinus]PPK60415.1 signal peptidase II [Malaciobacter marinus]SKB56549.1 signal peptidase II [Malaciobacter marinus]